MGLPKKLLGWLRTIAWRKHLAVVADFITLKDAAVGVAAIVATYVGLQIPRQSLQPQRPPSDVVDAINGICSREILIQTAGSLERLGVDYALKRKDACEKELTEKYMRRGGRNAT
jgi:hypothetical protein